MTPLRDFEVTVIEFRGLHPPSAQRQCFLFAVHAHSLFFQRARYDVGNLRVGADAYDRVHFGDFFENRVAIALRQTARHNQALNAPFLFERRQFENLLDGFRLGAFDETAGIDNCHVRHCRVRRQFIARVRQKAQQQFCVHLIFRTA